MGRLVAGRALVGLPGWSRNVQPERPSWSPGTLQPEHEYSGAGVGGIARLK